MSLKRKTSKRIKISFTIAEVTALLYTSDQMKDELSYYKFMEKDEFKAFCKGYNTGITKLKKALPEIEKNTETIK